MYNFISVLFPIKIMLFFNEINQGLFLKIFSKKQHNKPIFINLLSLMARFKTLSLNNQINIQFNKKCSQKIMST